TPSPPTPGAAAASAAPDPIYADLLLNTDPALPKSASGTPWLETIRSKNSNGHPLVVRTSKAPGTKALRFQVFTRIDAPPDVVFRAMNDEKMAWDENMAELEVESEWPADESLAPGRLGEGKFVKIRYSTKPALGGTISPRGFSEVRWAFAGDGKLGFVGLPQGWRGSGAGNDAAVKMAAEPPPKSGKVAARNLEAGQLLVAAEGGGTEVSMVSVTEIGGWLPAATVNGATSQSLVDSVLWMTSPSSPIPAVRSTNAMLLPGSPLPLTAARASSGRGACRSSRYRWSSWRDTEGSEKTKSACSERGAREGRGRSPGVGGGRKRVRSGGTEGKDVGREPKSGSSWEVKKARRDVR
ncbi:hypothetical protein TeGR_g11988, partial [Tetraparma gracilis]